MKYPLGTPIDYSEMDVRHGVEVPQFEDLEIVVALETAREFREEILFKIGIGGSVLSAPFLHKDVLYFGCNDKNFYAVSTEGKEIWRFPTEAPVMNMANISEGMIYFGSYDCNFYALDMEGNVKWKFTTQDMIYSTPCIRGQRIYFGSKDGNLYCLNARTGRGLWRFVTGGPAHTSPLCKNGIVYFSSDDKSFYAVDEKSGGLLWRFMMNEEPLSMVKPLLSVYKNIIYFGSYDSNLYALTLEGKLLWKFKCGNVPYFVTVLGERIFFGSRDNNLYCLDTRTGRELWRFATKGFVITQPLAYNDRIYFGSGDKNLYCTTLDGKLLWSFPTNGPVASSPTADEKAVYFGSWDCNLYAVSHEGKLLWKFHTSLSYQSPIELESPAAREVTHQVLWSKETHRGERYGKELPERLSDYGEDLDTYQSIGIRTAYMAGPEKPYKSKRKYG